jgi:hypothetical protein
MSGKPQSSGTKRATPPTDPPTVRSFSARSIEERLSAVDRKLVILIGVCDGNNTGFDKRLQLAVREELQEMLDEVFWLARLPALVLNLPAPTDDEIPDELLPKKGEFGAEYADPVAAARAAIIAQGLARKLASVQGVQCQRR